MNDTNQTCIPEVPTNAAVGFQAGLASAVRIEEILGVPHLINPVTGEAKSFEHLLTKPARRATNRALQTIDSFNEYLKRFKKPDSSIYVKRESAGFVIIADIDHRSETELAWDDHKVSVSLQYSEALSRWLGNSKRTLSQEDFADLLEERSREITSPDAAEILELAQSLHITRNLSVKSLVRANRANNTIAFNQEQSLKGGDGTVDLPTKFTIHLEAFARHRTMATFDVLLRPRVREDKPVFVYELQNVEETIEVALDSILHGIGSQTALPIYH